MTKISVVMLTRNSQKYLTRCIDAIMNQKYPNFEIIVVDSHSTDETLYILNIYNRKDIIKLHGKYKKIKIITNNEDISVGRARQMGVENSEGDIIAFVDSDVELPHENWLRNMSSPFIETMFLAGFGITYDIDKIAGVQTLAKAKTTDPWILKRIHNKFEYKNTIIDKNTYQPIGTSHILLRKDILQNAGGFPDVFHGEDIVVMKNIVDMGYKFVYLRDEKCYHYHVDSLYSHILRQLRGIKNQIKTKLYRKS